MASKKHERRIARESALALLYSCDITQADIAEMVENGNYPDEDFVFPEYAERLVLGVAEKQDEIDGYLAATSENWTLDRMPVVDRALLRLAVYEMIYVDNVPVSVAINEAVELAKAYGGEDESSRFVNGILGRIARSLNLEGASDSEDAASEDASAEVVADIVTGGRVDAAVTGDQADAAVDARDDLQEGGTHNGD